MELTLERMKKENSLDIHFIAQILLASTVRAIVFLMIIHGMSILDLILIYQEVK